MNKQRRARLNEARKMIAELQNQIDLAKDIIDECRAEEEEYKDNLPENMQDGEKGQAADDAIDHMQNAFDALENFDIDEITTYLEDAAV
jgi:chromosome segregation ATPase